MAEFDFDNPALPVATRIGTVTVAITQVPTPPTEAEALAMRRDESRLSPGTYVIASAEILDQNGNVIDLLRRTFPADTDLLETTDDRANTIAGRVRDAAERSAGISTSA